MCEFHLKGNCFHPAKVGKGSVASPCDVHSCNHCTNQNWQTKMIQKEIGQHQALLNLAMGNTELANQIELVTTRINIELEDRHQEQYEAFVDPRSKVTKINS